MPGRFMRMARYAWAAPCSTVGLMLALPWLLLGASARRHEGVIEISLAGFLHRTGMRHLPFRAITFGHVIIGVSRASLGKLRSHERVHVRQYEQWGPFFLLAYPLSSLLQLLVGRSPYWHNWFEKQAYAEQAQAAKPAHREGPDT